MTSCDKGRACLQRAGRPSPAGPRSPWHWAVVVCLLATMVTGANPQPSPSRPQCLYVTNTGNGRLQMIDVATAQPLMVWTVSSRSSGRDAGTPPTPPVDDLSQMSSVEERRFEGKRLGPPTASPSASPLSMEEQLMLGSNQSGLTVGKNPTGLWVEEPYVFVSYKWQGHISVYNLRQNMELAGRIVSERLLWCWSGQLALSREGVLYVTCTDDLQIHRFRWEGFADQELRTELNFTELTSIPTLRPTYGLKFLNRSDSSSLLLVSTSSENTIFLLNITSPLNNTAPQPLVQQPPPVVSYLGIETQGDSILVIDGLNSFVRKFNLSNPSVGQVFMDFSMQVNNTLSYQLSDFVDIEFGNLDNSGRNDTLFITSQRSDRIELFTAKGRYLGPFIIGNDDGTTISEPQNLFFGSCPMLTYPSFNASQAQSGSDLSTSLLLGLILPVLIVLALMVLGTPSVILLLHWYKNRRRTFDPADEEENAGMEHTSERKKYVYREIEPADLVLGEQLGAGAFGKVYRGFWRGGPVAVKLFDHIKLADADEQVIDEIRKEAEMMEKLGNHPNVISFVGAITRPSEHFIGVALVTDYCPRGSLYDLLIKGRAKVNTALTIRMARDAAAGLLHLHRERIIHRDIAARNVLVDNNYNVFIADFGLARVLKGEVDITSSNFGPVRWMAPEAMMKREYSEASDAFSYGVLLWEMVTRKVPWRGVDPSQIIIAVAQKNTRLKIPKGCDPILRKIMRNVWKENPRQRMTMSQIVDALTNYYEILANYEGESEGENVSSDNEEAICNREKEAQIGYCLNDGHPCVGVGATRSPRSPRAQLRNAEPTTMRSRDSGSWEIYTSTLRPISTASGSTSTLIGSVSVHGCSDVLGDGGEPTTKLTPRRLTRASSDIEMYTSFTLPRN